MPPPSSENDLKRRARRRLIGAVALTLLAVTVLPLLLEDTPPPASSLAVKMAVLPAAEVRDEPHPPKAPATTDAPAVTAAPQPALPQAVETKPAQPQPQPAPRPRAIKAEAAKPAANPEAHKPERRAEVAKSEAPKPATKAETHKPASQSNREATSEAFVVQLAALSDPAKANALKARAALAGLPAYSDKVGSLTRVRVGPYGSREAAVDAAAKLAANGMAGQVLAK